MTDGNTPELAIATARRLALRAQGLAPRWVLPGGEEAVAQAVDRLGRVQIDTIAVVQRAHHHVLWSRVPGYAPPMLDAVHCPGKRVFEYWWRGTACYLPMADYRYSLPHMRSWAESARGREWLEANREVVQHVRDRIRDEGPLGSADFDAPDGHQRGSWWNWKPAKQVLEHLFGVGELMVAERRNFQRLYDLAERVLPTGLDTSEPSHDERQRFGIRRAAGTLGLVQAEEIGRFLQGEALDEAVLARMTEAGEVVRLDVPEANGAPWYAEPGLLRETLEAAEEPPALHIVSPFDGLIINRRRQERLFGFDFRMECYLPAAKRQYGYWCLPILWGDRFAGRLDPKADRKAKTLLVHAIHLEDGFVADDAFVASLAEALRGYAAFNECDTVSVGRSAPKGLAGPLRRALR